MKKDSGLLLDSSSHLVGAGPLARVAIFNFAASLVIRALEIEMLPVRE